jgi:isoprenylcysteine carboxyl methyltransferase (ICMT) family protein YpbQ
MPGSALAIGNSLPSLLFFNVHLDPAILILFSLASITRLASLFKSATNEKKLKKANAVEYGSKNSKLLVFCHTVFYLSCLGEAVVLNRHIKNISFWGFGLFVFSMVMLWIVIFNLKGMWTVKLIISPVQQINKSFFFKYFRHPNYFLNIIPELISVALICQAWFTLAIGLPLYCIPLCIRIIQEEKLMKTHFSNY